MGIIKEKGEGQSFCSWILWLLLDIALIIPTLEQGGRAPFILLMASSGGSLVISGYLFFKVKKVRWGKNEMISLFLVIVTFLLWALSEYGEKPIVKDKNLVITLGVIAQVIAGWPLTKESWKKPRPIYIIGYSFFILGCIFSLTFEKSVLNEYITEEHLFPIALGTQTVVDIIPLIRKLLKKRTKSPAP
ncbi:MAG: hypothetical protein WC603_02510 [Candidatus Paceibacterota bacterium]